MSTILADPGLSEGEQGFVLRGVDWDQYVRINDTFPNRRGLRMIYIDGSLTLLALSRRHGWFSDRLDAIVKAVATSCEIEWETAGSATFRLEDEKVGVEGDRAYYFGTHAEVMRGPIDIDLATQPPPDLAIEVEVSHPADKAVGTYARIGVPEVWRIDARRDVVTFWSLEADGSYRSVARSRSFPLLAPGDVLDLLRLAEGARSSTRWLNQLNEWVRLTFLPRAEGG